MKVKDASGLGLLVFFLRLKKRSRQDGHENYCERNQRDAYLVR